jgi:hypothetical protein
MTRRWLRKSDQLKCSRPSYRTCAGSKESHFIPTIQWLYGASGIALHKVKCNISWYGFEVISIVQIIHCSETLHNTPNATGCHQQAIIGIYYSSSNWTKRFQKISNTYCIKAFCSIQECNEHFYHPQKYGSRSRGAIIFHCLLCGKTIYNQAPVRVALRLNNCKT